MANTYTLISSNTLSSASASVSFSSIPSTYTDLCVKISARDTGTFTGRWIRMRINSISTSNYSETFLRGDGTAGGSGRTTGVSYIGNSGWIASTGSDMVSTFGTTEFYIPGYTVAQEKPLSIFSAEETNSTIANMAALAGYITSTAVISGLTFYANASFEIGSSFYLYGIKNS